MEAPLAQLAEVAPLVRMSARHADDIVVAAFEAHQHELFTFLARTLRNDAEAEDLVQDTFLRLATEVRAGRVPDQVRAWLYRVATNLATSRFRRRSVVARWLERFAGAEHDAPPEPSPESRVLNRERAAEMERALRTLPEDARLALLLAGEGFPGREIAEALGRSEAATRTLICRSRIRLRTELEGGEP
jgi:RNA polymerase sigma-70 factor, ECF subfamily